MLTLYVLAEDGRTPVPCGDDVYAWDEIMRDRTRRTVAVDEVGGIFVSTVFLGNDHNFSGEGAPVLWETMIFGGRLAGYMERYSSYDDAVNGHRIAVMKAHE